MDRRQFVGTAGTALCVALSGCTGGRFGGNDDRSERPRQSSGPVESPDGTHHLFVENLTDTTEPASVRVVRDDGATLVDGRYELPDGRGIRFDDVAAWERTYTVELAIDGEDPVSLQWETRECGSESESPQGGSRNASVRVRAGAGDEDRVSIVVDQCDAIFAPAVPVGPADNFRLDE